jgi:hypothetical protein
MHSSTLPTRIRAAAVAALALLAACADGPTTPGGRAAAGVPAFATSPSGARLISNSVKYADTGRKASTGRAGSAAITALALRGGDGVTELEVKGGPANPASPAVASIQKVKTKATDWNGEQIFEANHTGLSGPRVAQSYGGLGWGATLTVQANVTGIDPNRTDVVEATVPVLLRPDLRVFMFGQPTLVRDGSPLALTAYVFEANGQVGARADCALYVDGVAEDRAAGIWVDAGGFVTCAFNHTFSGAGRHQVEVRVENVSPRDYDATNNHGTVAVEVVAADNHFSEAYAASVSSETESSWSSVWRNKVNGNEGDGSGGFVNNNYQQYGNAYGSLNVALAAPFTVNAAQLTGGVTVHSTAWQVDALPGGCASRFDGSAGVFLYVCVWQFGNVGQTTFRYDRATGSVTYHSRDYSRQWDAATGTEYVYNYNYESSQTNGPVVLFGADYSFRMSFVTADGTYPSNVTFPVATEESVTDLPETCYQADNADYFSRSCSSYFSRNRITRGSWPGI